MPVKIMNQKVCKKIKQTINNKLKSTELMDYLIVSICSPEIYNKLIWH